MDCRSLFKLSVIALLLAVVVKVAVTMAQERVQVGVAKCEVFTDLGGTRCANARCITPGDSFTNYADCTPDPSAQDKQLCEIKPFDCTIVSEAKCLDSVTIGYSYTCPDIERGKSFTETITCPVTCTKPTPTPTPCPTPPPSKPKPSQNCRWLSNPYCTWECDFVEACDSGGYWNSFTQTCEYSMNPGCQPGEWGFDHHSSECANGSYFGCQCNVWVESPVLVDVLGDGFALTDAPGGVLFDIAATGTPKRVAWTSAGSDDAWLALDRDGDGVVGGGAELFGNRTAQPPSSEPNGFRALAEFDRAERGGNADGQIDGGDSIFVSLRLWRDTNHNGRSEAGELHTLPALDVAGLDLDYKESKRVDEHGNQFRYRAKVRDARGAGVGRWAWDVFLNSTP